MSCPVNILLDNWWGGWWIGSFERRTQDHHPMDPGRWSLVHIGRWCSRYDVRDRWVPTTCVVVKSCVFGDLLRHEKVPRDWITSVPTEASVRRRRRTRAWRTMTRASSEALLEREWLVVGTVVLCLVHGLSTISPFF